MSLPPKPTNILVCEEQIVVSENNSIRVFIRQCSLNVSRTQEIVRTFNHYIASYALSSSSSPCSHSSSPTSSITTTSQICRAHIVPGGLVRWLFVQLDEQTDEGEPRRSEDNIKARQTQLRFRDYLILCWRDMAIIITSKTWFCSFETKTPKGRTTRQTEQLKK